MNKTLYLSAMIINLTTLYAAEHLEPSTSNELMPRILTKTEVSSKITSPETSEFLGFLSPDELNLSENQMSQPTDALARPLTFYERTRTPLPVPDELKPYAQNPEQNGKTLFVLPNWHAYDQAADAIETTPGISFLVETPSVASQTQPQLSN